MKTKFKFDFFYCAFLDRRLHPGVTKKIEQTIKSMQEAGYIADLYLVAPKPTLTAILRIMIRIVFCRAKTIIVRSSSRTLILIPAFIIVKLQSKKIILEVPTPIRVAINEVWSSELNIFKKVLIICAQFAAFPLCFFFVDRVLEYADESIWFSWGNQRKIRFVSNGIDVKSISYRAKIPTWPEKKFKLIGVAAIAFWHGFDRVIHGLAKYKEKNSGSKSQTQVEFLIVGPLEGQEYLNLKNLAHRLALEDEIQFMGALDGEQLSQAFEEAHIAVGSIGLHRIGLQSGSPLKLREYTARGLPFISALDDQDFMSAPDFVFKISPDESPVDIKAVIDFYENFATSNEKFLEIRRYAEDRLDFKHKIEAFKL